jgi:hypothetical protein
MPHWPSYARKLKREAKRIAGEEDPDFDSLIHRARGIPGSYYRAQALAWIAREMASAGRGGALLFSEAIEAARGVPQGWRRAEVLVAVASVMVKSGTGDPRDMLAAIEEIPSAEHRKRARKAILRRMARRGIDLQRFSRTSGPSRPPRGPPRRGEGTGTRGDLPPKGKKRPALALLNTYTGEALKEAHIRAIARAAPLCYAFDLDLCLLDFPSAEGGEIVERVEGETRVGEAGGYLRRLHKEGRLFVLESPWGTDLGEWVATTAHPDPRKWTEIEAIAQKGRPFCVLMGLGSRGLPDRVLKEARYHVELTGRSIPLETCTAMGVLAAKLGASHRIRP